VNRKADFFYKTYRFESIRITNRIESIRIANWNALVCKIGPLNAREVVPGSWSWSCKNGFAHITAKCCHWCVSFTIITTMVKEYISKIANICTVKINILAFPWWRHVVEGIFTIPKMYNLVTNWHIKQSAAIKHRCFACFQIPLYFAVDMRFSKRT